MRHNNWSARRAVQKFSGNHTDHNHGRVLAASVTLDTLAAVASNGTNTVHLYSEASLIPSAFRWINSRL